MTPTDITTIIISSIFIAGIAFFSTPWLSMVFILIFVYLLPRAGFLIQAKWYPYPLPIGYIFAAFIITKWFFYLLFAREKIKKRSPIDKIFLLYVITAILAFFLGIINKGNKFVMVLEISVYFMAFFIFFMVLDMFGKRECVKIFINGFLICGLLVSLYGILLLSYGKSLLVRGITYNAASYTALVGQFILAKRTLSSYGDPNTLSAQLMVFCSIFTGLLLQGKYKLMYRIFLLIGLVCTVICLYFASSRASLMGLFVLLVIFAMTKIKKMWLYLPILTIGYIMFLEPIRKYYEHRIYTTGITSDLRITYLKTFLDLVLRFPLGAGFGTSIENFRIIPSANIWHGYNSFYLEFFSIVGIHGLVIFILMFFLILKYLLRESAYIKDINIRYFIFGGVCGLIAQQFNFLTNNVYHVPGGMLNFWVMCGMLTAMVNLYKDSPTESPPHS